jgi:hypothetical protein
MATPLSEIKLTIYFNDTELNSEEQDEQVQRLLAELKEIDEVESVGRVIDPSPPEGNKTLGGFLAGLVKAEVYAVNAKKVLGFLRGFLVGKPIELSVEAGGKKLSVKANNPAELEAAIKAAQDFIAS